MGGGGIGGRTGRSGGAEAGGVTGIWASLSGPARSAGPSGDGAGCCSAHPPSFPVAAGPAAAFPFVRRGCTGRAAREPPSPAPASPSTVPIPHGAGPVRSWSRAVPIPHGADPVRSRSRAVLIPHGTGLWQCTVPVPHGADPARCRSRTVPVPQHRPCRWRLQSPISRCPGVPVSRYPGVPVSRADPRCSPVSGRGQQRSCGGRAEAPGGG